MNGYGCRTGKDVVVVFARNGVEKRFPSRSSAEERVNEASNRPCPIRMDRERRRNDRHEQRCFPGALNLEFQNRQSYFCFLCDFHLLPKHQRHLNPQRRAGQRNIPPVLRDAGEDPLRGTRRIEGIIDVYWVMGMMDGTIGRNGHEEYLGEDFDRDDTHGAHNTGVIGPLTFDSCSFVLETADFVAFSEQFIRLLFDELGELEPFFLGRKVPSSQELCNAIPGVGVSFVFRIGVYFNLLGFLLRGRLRRGSRCSQASRFAYGRHLSFKALTDLLV